MQLDFTSEELIQYRVQEMIQAVFYVQQLFKNDFNPDYVRGAMAMFKKIMDMPKTIAKSDEQKQIAQALVNKAMEIFEKKLLRAVVEGED